MILFFTGTGNSRYVAKRLAFILNDETVDLFEYIHDGKTLEFTSEKPWIIVTPTYSWRIPRIVRDCIAKAQLRGSEDCFFLMTCGSDIGNAGKYNKKLCDEIGKAYKGTKAIVMPENYIAMFDAPDEKLARAIIKRSDRVINRTAELIRKGEVLSQRTYFTSGLKSSLVNRCFYPFFVSDKKFVVDDKCVGCGVCVKNCPLSNISLESDKPVWNGNCTHCMACICQCPKGAIEYGTKSVGQPRYRCPM